jgi:hypothetical protein
MKFNIIKLAEEGIKIVSMHKAGIDDESPDHANVAKNG